MKKFLVVLMAVLLVTGVTAPALAGGGHGSHGGGRSHGGHGGFWPGYGWGFFSGAILGGALAAPYYYAPYYAPYYYAPPPPANYYAPQPSCSTQPGYWQQAPLTSSGGFTTYQNVWAPPQTVCR